MQESATSAHRRRSACGRAPEVELMNRCIHTYQPYRKSHPTALLLGNRSALRVGGSSKLTGSCGQPAPVARVAAACRCGSRGAIPANVTYRFEQRPRGDFGWGRQCRQRHRPQPARAEPGDYFVASENLFRQGTKVGTDHATCTLTRFEPRTGAPKRLAAQCLVTLVLPEGQVTAQGVRTGALSQRQPPRFTLAITGGTGAYNAERGDRLRGGFAAADGALHVAVPPGGTLGTGPVDASGRCAPPLAVGRPDSRCEVRAVAAAGELLGHPVPLDVLLGPAGRAAEVADETADHRLPPFGLAAARPRPRLLALKEAHQHPGPTGRR